MEKSELRNYQKMLEPNYLGYINDKENRGLNKFGSINKVVYLLSLEDKPNDVLFKYEDIIMDKIKLTEHLNIIRILKTDEYINNKINSSEKDSYNIKCFDDVYHKIQIIRQFEAEYKLNKFEVLRWAL